MLIAKGYDVGFRLADKGEVFAPKNYAALHDPAGQSWPKCSVLIAPFRRGSTKVNNEEAEKYFGYAPRGGPIHLPARDLRTWREIGDVQEIDYWRPGEHKGDWWHPFREGGWLFGNGGPLPVLHRLGRVMRLELGPGCKLSWRGFEIP